MRLQKLFAGGALVNKPIYFCIGMLSLIAIIFNRNWGWISSSDSLLGAFIGIAGALIGAVIGGIVSGYYSYQGGIRGAKENFELLEKQHKKLARAQLRRQIEFTLFKIDNWHEKVEKNHTKEIFFRYGQLVYDQEWFKHISILDEIPIAEQDAIVLWFNALSDLNLCKTGDLITGEAIRSFYKVNADLRNNVIIALRVLN